MHSHDHGAHAHRTTPTGEGAPAANRRRLLLVLVLALGYAVIELLGGWLTGSLALLADSLHMVSDVAALALSLLAAWMAARPASRRRTFGNRRAEILAALTNGLALGVVAGFITLHAIERFLLPRPVQGEGVMIVALGGLLINLLGLWVLEGGRGESLNVRGAWLHVASDALASVGVLASGLGIWAFGWLWLDPAVSIVVSGLVLYSAWQLAREALDVLMEGVPAHLDPEEIRATLLAVPGVADLHCLHVWTIGSADVSLSSHLVVEAGREPDALLSVVRDRLGERFGIEHTTIQLELQEGLAGPEAKAACADACEALL
ncbi:MAG: cation transporter [Spirochaetaceae bacterium]|nr:cation transporter [Myxococcales bacterium]MCB9723680.1 cation transporter [Spirochaetaceae bacterium]